MMFPRLMIKAQENLTEIVKECLLRDTKNCLYIYLDICQYGIESDSVSVWVNDIDNIKTVFMQYYNSGHIYSLSDNIDYLSLSRFIKEKQISMLSGHSRLIENLSTYLHPKSVDYGWVAKSVSRPENNYEEAVEDATAQDFLAIAQLICSEDSIGGHYNPVALEEQLEARWLSGFGRNKVIRIGDEMVAHGATYAENDKIAVVSGIVSKQEYRGKGLGRAVINSLTNDLLLEGKDVYLYIYDQHLIRFYSGLGYEPVTTCGKISGF